MSFQLTSKYKPTGDQPEAIAQLSQGVRDGLPHQTLLGVTGSGKTFTIANVIQQVDRPTLVISHNKTLAAQLYSEFKAFFPNNAVEYFVYYYDYYQPEAYLINTDTYIEKDMAINAELDKLRLRATASLLSGRRDVIVVASVSCIYGMANPNDFENKIIKLEVGMQIERDVLMRRLAESYYVNNKADFVSGSFRVKGDTIDIFPAIESFEGVAYRIELWDDEIDRITIIDPVSAESQGTLDNLRIYPANLFVTTEEQTQRAIVEIKKDLGDRTAELEREGHLFEAKRLYERVSYDLEMIKAVGYCSGIENYSRYFDGRKPGERPFCLMDYFPDDYLLVIDESHVSIPQIRAMYGGDKARKTTLVEYGFRLPAALDNRPLEFSEFVNLTNQVIYVSATPADYELNMSEGVVVEQVIRPTGLLDPPIEIRPTEHQVDDLMEEIVIRTERNERTLVTTLTKRMAEELSDYLIRAGIKCAYIHSDVDTLERIQIMDSLREGAYDVLVGVNLLREGLDFPEVSLVAILDADKEGFLRSHRSLTQTAGRAARNVHGLVIFYADSITDSMHATIDETNRRRAKQIAYNEAHNITPTQVVSKRTNALSQEGYVTTKSSAQAEAYVEEEIAVASPVAEYLTQDKLPDLIEQVRKQMYAAAKELNFVEAARLRDEMYALQSRLEDQKK
ncbi:MAG: excinuclease ABC subunit UvrB [Porphyromonas sp.]|uniref:excinuclease ABC subunit UvrB n=1 Tax=Porphyromonas sp. TaxID=1924944 RepID=UPI002A839FDD|nr:excinuclease ABC subunit UvrB [Porphyromonas sp.]MDY4246394.1 excinuclease ABC subunit UvrB [Porphyromonas sp.]